VPALLTCFVVGAFTATLVLLLKFDVPATNRDIIVYMIGQLSGGFTSALAFWLGTTKESGRKTELLAQAPAVEQGGK
jgi:glycerol uptake facilitator-like aquaporin